MSGREYPDCRETFPQLVITDICDPYPNCPNRYLKLMGSSVSRSLYSGSILIVKSHHRPVFKVNRGIDEISDGGCDPYIAAAEWLESHPTSEWIIFASSSSICSRNIDHLIPSRYLQNAKIGPEILLPETDNSEPDLRAFWAAKKQSILPIMSQWKSEVDTEETRDKRTVWTSLIKKSGLRIGKFETGEIYFPEQERINWARLDNAALISVPAWSEAGRWRFLQSVYMGSYFSDPMGLINEIIDP